MGLARRKDTPFETAIGPQDLASPPANVTAQFPADYFDTPQEVAANAGRELIILRQARQLRDAWRRGRYGRLLGE